MLNTCILTQFKILQIFPFMLIDVIQLNKLMESLLLLQRLPISLCKVFKNFKNCFGREIYIV